MGKSDNILEQLVGPISHSTLMSALSSYRHPEQTIKFLKSNGKLKSIYRGWYYIPLNLNDFSRFHFANVLYGPSYVSATSALSFYGLIPEKVFTTESITFKRGKKLNSKVGRFEYYFESELTFHLGIKIHQFTERISFLIATPTKALYDYFIIANNLEFSGQQDLLDFLETDLRFDTDALKSFDIRLLEELALTKYKRRTILILINLIKKLNNDK